MAVLAHYKSVCVTPSWVIAKAVKVAAETSSNSYDIKNRADVFPVRCSVKPPRTETPPAAVKFVSAGFKSQVVPPGSSKILVVIQTNGASLPHCTTQAVQHCSCFSGSVE